MITLMIMLMIIVMIINMSVIITIMITKKTVIFTYAAVAMSSILLLYQKTHTRLYIFYAVYFHYNDIIMSAVASQITGFSIVYSTVVSDADQRKHQNSASMAFVGKSPVTREFPAQKASDAENVSIWWRHHVFGSFLRAPSVGAKSSEAQYRTANRRAGIMIGCHIGLWQWLTREIASLCQRLMWIIVYTYSIIDHSRYILQSNTLYRAATHA